MLRERLRQFYLSPVPLIRHPRLLVRTLQFGIFVFSGATAFLLRFDFSVPPDYKPHLVYGVAIWAVVKSIVFYAQGLDQGWWRYVSIPDVRRITLANLAGSFASGLAILVFGPFLMGPDAFPRSLYILDFLICLLLTAGVRVATRALAEIVTQGNVLIGKKILIYGAGAAGIMLLRETKSNPNLGYHVAGFIDDDPQKKGLLVQGVPVLGTGTQLPEMVRAYAIQEVLIALPSAGGVQMTQILSVCRSTGVKSRTIPALSEVLENRALASQIRDVNMDDLLGRSPVKLHTDQILTKLEGKVILVSGAAGSIGSELCRQMARFHPQAIVGFDVAETGLFHLDWEMRRSFPQVPFYPEIGMIQDRARLAEIFRRHGPSILYHAAAYKHVPMMENHVFEAVENNVFGTLEISRAAFQYGLEDFVMISTDKAVRPTSMMGVTKRLAELLILSLQNETTKFVSVRFGNVLGSNGSVVPLFKQQIATGGPITVTHPEMRRYFMTIPEAAQLVIQSSAMGKGGEIFVLDMGEPVRIVDLARNLILLSGLRPDEDIKIEFTGIRPGEKLYEELATLLENTQPTSHEKVKIFTGPCQSRATMDAHLAKLREICAARDLGQLVVTVKEIVPEYNLSTTILQRILKENAKEGGPRVLTAPARIAPAALPSLPVTEI